MNRRNLFLGSAAMAVSTLTENAAFANGFAGDFEMRGSVDLYERLPRLNTESTLDFHTGYRKWMARNLRRVEIRRARDVLKANGIDPRSDAPLDDVVEILTADPQVAMYMHNWERTQEAMWQIIKQECDRNADVLLDELAAAEKLGPSTLELNKDLKAPDYACYEIHIQPGGYVGDRFAGHIYYHGTSVVLLNDQDEMQRSFVRGVPRPADGKVRRVLDQGTGCGQFAMALKQKFPEAEVWADDVAGPMLRFAQLLSVERGAEIHYVQRLSEDNGFPDEYFDIVTNNLLIHEVPAVKVKEILAEAYRTLRPGGVYYPLDSYTGAQTRNTALSKYYAWRNYRWNHEVWWMEYYHLDLAQTMRDVGFEVDEHGPKGRSDTTHNIVGYKV